MKLKEIKFYIDEECEDCMEEYERLCEITEANRKITTVFFRNSGELHYHLHEVRGEYIG